MLEPTVVLELVRFNPMNTFVDPLIEVTPVPSEAPKPIVLPVTATVP